MSEANERAIKRLKALTTLSTKGLLRGPIVSDNKGSRRILPNPLPTKQVGGIVQLNIPYVVSGVGANAYHCPSLSTTDHHIAHVRKRLSNEDHDGIRAYLQRDMDRLLDHRFVLAAVE